MPALFLDTYILMHAELTDLRTVIYVSISATYVINFKAINIYFI